MAGTEALTPEQADLLRHALGAARYEQEFDEHRNETWFSPDDLPESRVLFFSKGDGGLVVSYSDAKVVKFMTFREAMDLAQGGNAP